MDTKRRKTTEVLKPKEARQAKLNSPLKTVRAANNGHS